MINEIHQVIDLSIIKSKRIIGITTTGAARLNEMINNLNPKVVLVEEAAEILESQLVACLSDKIEQLILIGDHQQLQPSSNSYFLEKNKNFTYSLFERLIMNGFGASLLNTQRRMNPSISNLIKPIYIENQNLILNDHQIVLTRKLIINTKKSKKEIPNIVSRVFWWTHNEPEQVSVIGRSKMNITEVSMIENLVTFLTNNHINQSSITVIGAYQGQVYEIKKKLKLKLFNDVQVETVDKYQGSENDIIILSCVRSNPEKKIGFLGKTNRVCVALSRARLGLYIIGNKETVACGKNQFWVNTANELEKMNAIGPNFMVQCQYHKHINNQIHFSKFEELNSFCCNKMCKEIYIPCGHKCIKKCHEKSDHLNNCPFPCERILLCGHTCSNICHQICVSDCLVKLDKFFESCGHTNKVSCYQYSKISCKTIIKIVLECNHEWVGICSEDKVCNVKIDKTLSCGHIVNIECSKQESIIPCNCDGCEGGEIGRASCRERV